MHPAKVCLALLGVVLVLVAMPAEAATQQRTALIIGNATYASNPLRNSVNDAMDMAAALKHIGFTVTLLSNATLRTMDEAVRTFSAQLRQGGVGLFYYSGHGLQIAGENYLLPIGARIDREQDVPYEAFPVGRVLGGMEDARNPFNIVILDACRDNPLASSTRSTRKGLAPMQAAQGLLIAYATAPDRVAYEDDGRNGIYTAHLLQHITTPGLSVEHMFKQVRAGVVKVTGGKQVPWESSSLVGDFSFTPSPATPAPATSGAPGALAPTPTLPAGPDPEMTMWSLVERSTHPEDFGTFLKTYPESRFAPIARLKLQQLQRQEAAAQPSAGSPGAPAGQRLGKEAAKTTDSSSSEEITPADRQSIPGKIVAPESVPGPPMGTPSLPVVSAKQRPAPVAPVEKPAGPAAPTAPAPAATPAPPAQQVQVARLEPTPPQGTPPLKREEQIGSFIKYDNGTALDTRTNLMWMTQDFHNIEGRAPKDWDEAMAWAEKMNRQGYGGHSDWRIPTTEEYKKIYDSKKTKQSHAGTRVGYPEAFVDGGGTWFWTFDVINNPMVNSDPSPQRAREAWGVAFNYGREAARAKNHSQDTSVRLVRWQGKRP